MKDYFRDLLVENIDEAKVILTGVPSDKNASIGKGASKAPQVMRELSASEPALSMDGDDISACKIYDTGDVTYEGEDDVTYFAKVSRHLDQTLNTNKFNLVIGGDHSIAIASELSFLNYAKKHHKKPLIIHIDAPPDICDVYEGSKYSHACPIRRAIDNGYSTKDIILIGIRGFEKQEVEYFALHPEIKMFNANFIHNNGIEPIFKYLKEKFPNSFIIFSVYIDRSMDDRINCGIDQQRCERDLNRIEIPLNEYDYVIHNNYSLEEFKQKVKQLTLSLLK